MLTGTLINAATIVIASIAGILIGSKMDDEIRRALMNVLGLPVLLIGISMGLKTENVLIPTLSIVAGTIAGEILGIGGWLEGFGGRSSLPSSLRRSAGYDQRTNSNGRFADNGHRHKSA